MALQRRAFIRTAVAASAASGLALPAFAQSRTKVKVGYLHDGRARNLEEAVLWHAGEAANATAAFKALAEDERAALLRFLGTL